MSKIISQPGLEFKGRISAKISGLPGMPNHRHGKRIRSKKNKSKKRPVDHFAILKFVCWFFNILFTHAADHSNLKIKKARESSKNQKVAKLAILESLKR